MDFLIDVILHVDKHLQDLIQYFGWVSYVILFLIVFAETGLVVTPFLPGDSLLFALGAVCASNMLSIEIAVPLLIGAAIIGDAVNYFIGSKVGSAVFKEEARFFKKAHLEKTEAFYEKHGGKTIILARFMPIIRTFAPFVAGIGSMRYPLFATYNVVGAVAWVGSFCALGYWFGNMAIVKKYFSLVIVAIVILSILPGVWEILKNRKSAKEGA